MAIAIFSLPTKAGVTTPPLNSMGATYGNEINRLGAWLPATNIAGQVASATDQAVPYAPFLRNAGAGGSLGSLAIIPPASSTGAGVFVSAPASFTGLPYVYSKTGQADTYRVNNDASVTAPAFHGLADTAQALAPGTTLQGSVIAQGSIGDDRLAGLWYTASSTAMSVHVAPHTIWQAGSPIFFNGSDSPPIVTTGTGNNQQIGTGQARVDLLYIDGSGALQWQLGSPGPAASASLPGNPSGVFVPVVFQKTYFGATTITGYADQGHDSFFYRDARLTTTPALSSAIGPHSLSITRLVEGAVWANSPANTSVNAGMLAYYNSAGQQIDYPGGVYTYQNTQLLNTQPRWDLLYLDDGGILSLTQGTPAASPSRPIIAVGQWPRAMLYIPPNCNQIVDEANYTGAAGQGYIHFVPAYLAGNSANAGATTATGTITTSGTSPNIQVTAVNVTNGGSGYASPPAVQFVGGTGTAATAQANMAIPGVVTSVSILTPGAYTVAPTGVVFSSLGGIVPVSQGGTGGSTQAAARANLLAASSGTNGDIVSMTGLTGITGNVTVSGNTLFTSSAVGNVGVTIRQFTGQTAPLQRWLASDGTTVLGEMSTFGTIGQGGAAAQQVGMVQVGNVVSPTANVWVLAQNSTIKPGLTGGQATWFEAVHGGNVDMSALTAINDNVATAHGVRVGVITRGGTNPSVYAVNTITPTGTLSGGSFSISDGTNTTAGINPTAAIGDTFTTGTINYALSHATPAAVAYTATGSGPLSGGNTITLTANTTYNPGRKAALTMPSNAPTGGGSLAIAQTYPGAQYIANAYGGYFSQPTGGVNNYALYSNGVNWFDASNGAGMVDGTWTDGALHVSKVLSQSKNEAIMSIQGVSSGTTNNGTQRNGLIIFVTNNDQSNLFGTPAISRDLVAGDFQAFIGASNPQGRVWALNLQTSVLGTTPASDGNTVIAEARVDNNGVDGQYIGQSAAFPFQKCGINMIGRGPRMATAAYMVTQTTPNIWHHGFWADVSAIGTGASDTAFEVGSTFNATTGVLIAQGTFAVRGNGRTSIGSNLVSGAGVMLDVFGDAIIRQVQNAQPAVTIYGKLGSTADALLIDTTLFASTAMRFRVDKAGHVYATQSTPLTYTAFTGAGTSPTISIGGNDQSGWISVQVGSAPAGSNATIVQVFFSNAYTNTPASVILTPCNTAARNLAVNQEVFVQRNATAPGSFYVVGGTVALAAGATYEWAYRVN